MRRSQLLSVLSLFLLVPASITWAQTISSQKGLTTAEFNVAAGNIKVYLPDDIRPGDAISGTIKIEATGKNAKQIEKNLAELKKYSISFNSEKFPVGTSDDSYKFFSHVDRQLQAPIELLNVSGTKVQELPILPKPPNEQKPTPTECMIPTHALTAAPLSIPGHFDGNASNTTCTLNNKPVEVLAESPRQCILFYPADAGGLHTLHVQESGKPACSQPVSGVNMDVSAGKLDLRKGEKTFIDVTITGLQNLPDTAVLSLINMTTGVVTMIPSNTVVIPLAPDSVGTGSFTRHFDVQSTKTGSFVVNVNLDLPDVYYNTNPSETTQPPQPITKNCECSVSASIEKANERGNDFSFKANVKAECKGGYGTGYTTFIKCSVKSISYQWSIIDEKDNAEINGASNTDKVNVKAKNNNSFTVMLKVTVVCADGTTCIKEAAMMRSGAPVTGPITQPPTTGKPPTDNPPTTTERVKCGCECSVSAVGAKTGMKDGKMGFNVVAKGDCKNKPCPGNTTVVKCTTKITYSWSVTSGKDVAAINGKADEASVSVTLKGTGAYVLRCLVTVICSDGTTCEYPVVFEEYNPPTTTQKSCLPTVTELIGPTMDGGLKNKYLGLENKSDIKRDDYIVLEAEGADFDQLKFNCNPYDCPDKGSEKLIPVVGKVRFEWDITSKDEGVFVKLGCMPENKKDVGEHVIFKPPFVPLPIKASDTTIITTMILSVIDDGSPFPDPTQMKNITIKTKRSKSKPDVYSIEIVSDKYTLPGPPAAKNSDGPCQTIGPVWVPGDNLAKPAIILPAVPDNTMLVLGQWIVISTQDQIDPDVAKFNCTSASQCNTGPLEKTYNDNIFWNWTVSGGGRILLGTTGQYIVYEAPMEMPKGKEFIEVKVSVKVSNPAGDRKDPDKSYEEMVFKVYQPGVKLSQPPLDWLPTDSNYIEFKSELMYKDGDWKPALAHMCRIHYFELLNVSTEKGVCLNNPAPKDANDCRDLKLKNEDNHEAFDDKKAAGKCDQKEMYQQARTQRPEKEYSLKVYSLDFGSYGFLRSFANVNKGGKDSIRGEKPVYVSIPVKASDVKHPLGRPKKTVYGDNRVTIPYDVDENHIADKGWTTMGGVAVPDPADNNKDEDDKPVGDKFKGDGLTTYEEYRGFKVSTKAGAIHVRTNYEVKDVFIRNENNLDIGLYSSLSELDVHEISKEQYIEDDKRVINFNYNRATHLVDQRGLHLVDKGSSASLLGIAYSQTGQPTIPNWEIEIRIYTTNISKVCERKKLKYEDKIAAVIAHELLHGNNVCHHGEGDPEAEKAFDLVHGLRSGNVDCVMRYDNIGTALSRNPEAIGSIICTSAAGTGYNANGQHFGDADKNRGNCKGQIRISAVGGLPKSCGNR